MSAFAELAKLPAFMRRDLRIALSYRMGAATGLLAILGQAVVLSFLGKLVNPAQLPMYGGTRITYMEFVSIGIVFNMVVLLLLDQVATAIRTEQMAGTLEALLATPTAVSTIQAGSAAFELLYAPIRMIVFLVFIGLLFGLNLHPGGALPAVSVLIVFLPFLWGLGLLSAGAILTFRRGTGAVTIGAMLLGLASGAFFPLALFPPWLAEISKFNPLAITITALRETLIGGTGWASIASDVAELAPLSLLALAAGAAVFRLALKRERRLGTLGLY